jgi:FtsZ-binding cell division protein ZapB
MPVAQEHGITFSSSEMWIFGIFISIILAMIGFIWVFTLNQIKTAMSSQGEKMNKVLDLVQLHDKEIALMKEKVHRYDKEAEEVKHNIREIERQISAKLKAMTP